MLLSATGIKKEYGIQNVLNMERFQIKEGARIDLIGRNGIGKTFSKVTALLFA